MTSYALFVYISKSILVSSDSLCLITQHIAWMKNLKLSNTFSKVTHSNFLNMWHNQGEWVTCRQYSILIFQYKSLVHLKCYILIQTPSQLDTWLQRYEQFFKFKNNVKHKNLSPLSACNSKSIFPISDSFPLIISHTKTRSEHLLSEITWTCVQNQCMEQRISYG